MLLSVEDSSLVIVRVIVAESTIVVEGIDETSNFKIPLYVPVEVARPAQMEVSWYVLSPLLDNIPKKSVPA